MKIEDMLDVFMVMNIDVTIEYVTDRYRLSIFSEGGEEIGEVDISNDDVDKVKEFIKRKEKFVDNLLEVIKILKVHCYYTDSTLSVFSNEDNDEIGEFVIRKDVEDIQKVQKFLEK